jgi:S1-C subfamily serine protease
MGLVPQAARADEAAVEPRFILPGDDPSPTLRLGFHGHVVPGYGMAVDRVPYGSLASRIGLERGDVITRVNGWRIRSEADYFAAMRRTGRFLRLVVQDVRGRGSVPVTFDVYEHDPWEPRPYLAPEEGTVYRPVLPELQ